MPIVSTVGSQAVLPCSWKSELNVINNPICHIQWQTPASTVFEQRGTQRWEASEFKGRLVVPEDKLDQGDCSLILNDVQHGDVGLYESYVVVMKQRIFIQRVRLVVHGKYITCCLFFNRIFGFNIQGLNYHSRQLQWLIRTRERGEEGGLECEDHCTGGKKREKGRDKSRVGEG